MVDTRSAGRREESRSTEADRREQQTSAALRNSKVEEPSRSTLPGQRIPQQEGVDGFCSCSLKTSVSRRGRYLTLPGLLLLVTLQTKNKS